MMNNPLYSQHLEGDECDDERDANDTGAGQGDERDDEQDAIDRRGNMYEGDRSKDDRSKEGDRKNGDRNRDERFKNGDRNKEWPGTRKGAKTRDIKKGDINDTGVKDGKEQQNQATRSDYGCIGPVITNEGENPGKKGSQAKKKAIGDGFKDIRINHTVLKNIGLDYSTVRNIRLGCSGNSAGNKSKADEDRDNERVEDKDAQELGRTRSETMSRTLEDGDQDDEQGDNKDTKDTKAESSGDSKAGTSGNSSGDSKAGTSGGSKAGKNLRLLHQAKTGQDKTGIGTNFCRAENETKAKNQADHNGNLCLPYQYKNKEDKAKHQAETSGVTDLCQVE